MTEIFVEVAKIRRKRAECQSMRLDTKPETVTRDDEDREFGTNL